MHVATVKTRLIEIKIYKSVLVILISYLAIYSFYYFRLFDYDSLKKVLSFESEESINQFLTNVKQLSWLFPLFTVLFIFLRILLTTFCMLLGIYSNNESISARKIFKFSLIAECVYVLRDLSKVIYQFIQKGKNVDEYAGSFSIYSLFRDVIPSNSWLILPSKSISIYLLLYLVVLVALYKDTSAKSMAKSISFVLVYYLLGFALWIALNMSYNIY